MSDTLHKLLDAIEDADRATSKPEHNDAWTRVVELCDRLREEMAK